MKRLTYNIITFSKQLFTEEQYLDYDGWVEQNKPKI